ncbi:BCCT family transporter [Halopseudomonas pertucinogena]|uniref:Uncharacterized protein n=1 Tax=Halopseudomonas pertucinogena TaxID=86175 RepID=A0ABQ2CHM1_9GAMM|nr:BCCT family transporter [Halopseudomonas pertucinogena]GGI88505.1 hypothetical protein GCM10009083_01040 [Halopseudomonas pertucinogena]
MTLPSRTLQTFVYEPGGSEWMGGWTLFFWAFWLAWGPFVGVFLARISRGRTLREFVIAAITAPVLCDFIIVSLFGNSALFQVLQGNLDFAELAMGSPEQGWYELLSMFPGAMLLIGLATLSGLLFYLTSANSGAMVMSNFSASIPDPAQDGPKWLRIFWAVLTAVLTIAMLLAGGVTTMEYATLIFALPVTIIAYLVMMSFHKVLRMERAEREGQVLRRPTLAPIGGHLPERSWKQRLEQMRSYPSLRQVMQFMERTVRPALDELEAEFRNQGYTVEREVMQNAFGTDEPVLRVVMESFRAFHYQVAVVEAPVPMFTGRMSRETDVYYRLEVFTQTGSGGYDLMGLTKQQVIDDVLERYEAHLAFLTLSSETATSSVLTPSVLPKDEPPIPPAADDIHDLDDRKD